MRTYDASELDLNIPVSELQALFKTDWRIHTFDILLNWTIIAGFIYLSIRFFSIPLYILTVFIVGARMHALAILMHDATHFRFLKNKKMNDLITNVVSMYPIFTSIEKYRKNHLAHHRKLNTDEDPDWMAKQGKYEFTFPQSKREFILTLGSYLIFYQGIRDSIWFLKRFGGKTNDKAKRSSPVVPILFYIILFSAITWLGWWPYYLMYWIVPYLTTFFMFQYVRSVSEHFGGLTYDNLLTSTRTVKTSWVEQFFIAPHNVGYHLEHHLYPAVPYYKLPKLHALLMKHGHYKEKAHVTIGYSKGLLAELSS